MATKKKATAKAAAAKGGKKADPVEQEPLSTFQEPKTGRVDPPKKKSIATKSITTIEKVKTEKNETLFVKFSVVSSDKTSHHEDTFGWRMHPDLKKLFLSFRIHLALLCEYLSTQQIKSLENYSEELVGKFNVSSVSIKEDGVVITGSRVTKRGKHVILNTPFTLFKEDDSVAYRWAEELRQLVEDFQKEASQYITGAKMGAEPQQSLEFPEENEGGASDDDDFKDE